MTYDEYIKYIYYPVIFFCLGLVIIITVAATINTYGPDEHRGCIASAYQATRHSDSTLEANLEYCDKL